MCKLKGWNFPTYDIGVLGLWPIHKALEKDCQKELLNEEYDFYDKKIHPKEK